MNVWNVCSDVLSDFSGEHTMLIITGTSHIKPISSWAVIIWIRRPRCINILEYCWSWRHTGHSQITRCRIDMFEFGERIWVWDRYPVPCIHIGSNPRGHILDNFLDVPYFNCFTARLRQNKGQVGCVFNLNLELEDFGSARQPQTTQRESKNTHWAAIDLVLAGKWFDLPIWNF